MFTIEKAERKGTPALIALWGGSASGKTYSALRVARGLVGPQGKICVIDTENRRAEFYSDLVNGWFHLDLQPPFTPERYTQAIDACISYGADVVIVDSMSHVWEGEGGVLDMANSNGKKGAQQWAAPKMAYKRMLNHLLRAPCHVIFCLRAKDTMDWDSAKPKSLGLTPISGKNFIYEMTVSVLLGNTQMPAFQGSNGAVMCDPQIPPVKAPADLWHTIVPNQHLDEDVGQAIAAWVGSAAAFDFDMAALRKEARDLATMGRARMTEWWGTQDKAKQKSLLPIRDELGSIADQADREAAEAAESGQGENVSNHLGDNPLDDAPGASTPPQNGGSNEPASDGIPFDT